MAGSLQLSQGQQPMGSRSGQRFSPLGFGPTRWREDIAIERYATWEEAEAGHARMVARLAGQGQP